MPDIQTGMCVRCKKTVVMDNPDYVRAKNGTPIVKGTCHDCGTKMQKFLPGKREQGPVTPPVAQG